MTTHATTNLVFLNSLEAKVSYALEESFSTLQGAAVEQLKTLEKVLEAADPDVARRSHSLATLPNVHEIIWAGVAETLVTSCLDQILVHSGESERFLTQSDLISKWERAHEYGAMAKRLEFSESDLKLALQITADLLVRRATWMDAPELKRDGRLYRVESTDEELRVTSRPLAS